MLHGRRLPGNSLLAAALLVALGACGHRGDPLPPLRHTPPALSEFRLAQRGTGLEVSVLAPGSSVDGIAYESLAIEFLFIEGQKDLEKAGRRRQVLAEPLKRVVETLPLPAPGTVARAAARGVFGKEKGPRTLTMGLVVQAEVTAPRGLEAGLTENGVRVAWTGDVPAPVTATVQPPRIPGLPSAGPGPGSRSGEPPPAAPPGTAPVAGPESAKPDAARPPTAAAVGEASTKVEAEKRSGFLVYRRVGSAAYARPLAPGLIEKRVLQDAAAPQGEKVCYVVRAAASLEPLVESAASNEACLEVRDIAPPAAPTGLAVVPRERGLELVWTPSVDEDVKAYRIYREAPGAPRRLLAEVEAGRSAFTDETAKAGVLYQYALTAVDQAGNESPATSAVEATRE